MWFKKPQKTEDNNVHSKNDELDNTKKYYEREVKKVEQYELESNRLEMDL